MNADFDPIAFRNALGSFATGVTIVTTVDAAGNKVGLTANSFNSVSLDPPMVLWSLARNSQSLDAFRNATHFAVHILAADQEALSNIFAKKGADKFSGLTVSNGLGDAPLLDGCSARFQCRTAFQYEGGDHIIFVGEVEAFDHSPKAPLVFHGGRYAHAAPKLRDDQKSTPDAAPRAPDGSFNEDFLGYLLGRAHYQLYGRVEKSLNAHKLDAYDHFILSVLGLSDGRSIDEIDGIIGYTGLRATPARVQSLVERGLLREEGSHPSTLFWLTSAGQKTMIELTAVAKAAEEDALTQFDAGEAALLKHLLKRLITDTDPGLPNPWNRETT